jgi:hypothetical protein
MKVPVYMAAYHGKDVIRTVDVGDFPTDDKQGVLNEVFRLGQNDFQPQSNRYSVSVGDVIYYDGEYWAVMPVGFKKMTEEQFHKLPDEPLGADAYKIEDYITGGMS